MDVETAITNDLVTFQLRRALRTIDAHWEPSGQRFWQRAEALAGLERFDEAERAVLVIADAESLAPTERAHAAATAVRYRLRLDRDVDALLLRLGRALALAGRGGPSPERALVAIHLERMAVYARKRVRVLADRELAAARAAGGEAPEIVLAQARLHLAFDERIAARATYENARGLGAERGARLGLAHVAFLLGDFAAGYAALDGHPWGPDDLDARRRRIDLLEAEQRWSEVATELTAVLASTPHGTFALSDRLDRAAALERAGDLAGARAGLEQIVDDADDGRDARVAAARRSLGLLARAGETAVSPRRLRGFPTTAQLRNHCGPASCELYLRFLGRDADQLAIGSEIMIDADTGTTFDRMRGFLERTGLHVLRIEAPLPTIKVLIDLGIPVMLQESYATSGHATVAIGYDDARDVLEVQDPMTHAIRETPYEELDEILDMSNHGALIAIAPDERERLAALERAGIRECRYLVRTDRAYVALADGRLEEADALLDEALAERRDYELAWMCRFHVASARLEQEPTPAHRVRVLHIVEEASSIWPEDDWVRGLAARVAFADGDYPRAGTEYARACAAEPRNPYTWRELGHARLRAGDHQPAREALDRALAIEPGDRTTNELAAYARFLAGDHDAAGIASEIALALAPDNAFNHLVHADLQQHRGDLAGALASLERAIELDGSRAPSTVVRRSDLLSRLGLHADAEAVLRTATDADDPVEIRARRIDALVLAERHADAEALAAELAADPETARAGAELAARIAWRRQDHDLARARAAALLEDAPSAVALAILGEHAAVDGDDTRALFHLAAAATLAPDDPDIALALGDTLANLDERDAATTAFVRALRGCRANAAIDRAMRGLVRVGAAPRALAVLDELAAIPGRAREIDEARVELLTQIVWAPGSAAPLLRARAARGSNDPLSLAQRGLDRFGTSLAGEADGERMVRDAIAAVPAHRYPRWQLAELLVARGRGADALELVPERDHYNAVRIAVTACCKLARFDDARALVAAFAARTGTPPSKRLELTIAEAAGDHARALELARSVGADDGERDDDAQLDDGELRQFLLLLALERDDEAIAFGRAQAGSAMSLGLLAHRALAAGRLPGAIPLAEDALQIDPREAYALHVLGRAAEHRGDAAAARALYERAGAADPHWHAYLEELARLALAEGDPAAALTFADRAVATGGHTCFFALAVRAQARLVAGDLAGAREDGVRAFGLGDVGLRGRTNLDAWAVCALLRGDLGDAEALYTRYLADTVNAGPLDHARVAHVRAAHARLTA